MDPKIIKDTQESLGKIIKKPPLTDKLLTKPPFRFLHDIMTSVVKTTGFMQGLFTDDEMISENVKDKDSKIAFLQKVVDIVSLVVSKQLHVKPSKIVAGHEAEKTNLLLQSLAESINKNVNNDSYVQKVLGKHQNGEDHGKENAAEKRKPDKDKQKNERVDEEAEKALRKDRESEKRRSSGKETHDESTRDRQGSKERDKARHRDRSHEKNDDVEATHAGGEQSHKTRDTEEGRGREKEHRSKKVPSVATQNTASGKSPASKPTKQSPSSSAKTSIAKVDLQKSKTPRDKQTRKAATEAHKSAAVSSNSSPLIRQKTGTSLRNAALQRSKGSVVKKSVSDVARGAKSVAKTPKVPEGGAEEGQDAVAESSVLHRKERNEAMGDALKKEQPISKDDLQQAENTETINVDQTDVYKDSPAASNRRIERPSSAKGSRRRRDGRGTSAAADDAQEELVVQQMQQEALALGGEDPPLPKVLETQRMMMRPSSARPAPPQVKKQEALPDDPAIRLGSGRPSHLIVDDDQSDDDEFFLVEESKQPMSDPPQMVKTEDDVEGGDHGGLVKKILETKKELEGGSQQPQSPSKKTEIERLGVSDAARRKERDLVQKEVDKLRGCIQTLTRSANPLGKIMDYVQEDLDTMQTELREWMAENKEHALALNREQGITNNAIEPLRVHLCEIDSAIADQLEKIVAVKSNISANDKKIDKMLRSISKS